MYNPDTDLLFPPRVIPSLREARGAAWRDLVAGLEGSAPDSAEKTAFVLMMARLNNCPGCNADSFRAMHGCTACAKQALKRFRGTDEELAAQFQGAVSEVQKYFGSRPSGNSISSHR